MAEAPAEPRTYVGLGWLLCDNIMQLTTFPREDTKASAENAFDQVGGPVVRALMLLSKFGAPTRLIGAVGSDPAGKLILNELSNYISDLTFTVRDASASTRTAQVWLAQDKGTRTIVYSANGPDVVARFDGPTVRDAAAVLLDGRHPYAALGLAKLAQRHQVPVAIDMGSYKDEVVEFLDVADLVIAPARTWQLLAKARGHPDAKSLMTSTVTRTCVLTDGAAPAFATANGETAEHRPKPVDIVDSNGVGDVFFGAFVWAHVHSYALVEALRFASTAAAIKCTRLGNAGLPNLDEVVAGCA